MERLQALREAESQHAQRAEQALTSARQELSQRAERCADLERALEQATADARAAAQRELTDCSAQVAPTLNHLLFIPLEGQSTVVLSLEGTHALPMFVKNSGPWHSASECCWAWESPSLDVGRSFPKPLGNERPTPSCFD